MRQGPTLLRFLQTRSGGFVRDRRGFTGAEKALLITVLLGFTFTTFQVVEYVEQISSGFTLQTGMFGSTFYMATGFHGFHVFIGMLMLLFITLRLMKGHFSAERHFGFEGAVWYWHFVDVVWLGLYVLVYWM